MGTAFDLSDAWRTLTAADFLVHGAEGVLVYSGNARPDDEWCQKIRDAGLHLVWIWEDKKDAALRGFDYAVEQCRWHESRIPPGELTYVAACDLNDGDLAGRDVTAFLQGWAATTREPVFGQYGSSDAIQQGMTIGGKLQRFWGVATWLHNGRSNNHPENLQRWRDIGAHIIQLVPEGKDIPGTDTVETVQANWWSTSEGDDMPDEATLKKWIRDVLNEGAGTGQTGWAGTSKDTLGTAQRLVNDTSILTAKVDGLNAKVDKLAAAVAELKTKQP